jgi:hypothetical protein
MIIVLYLDKQYVIIDLSNCKIRVGFRMMPGIIRKPTRIKKGKNDEHWTAYT